MTETVALLDSATIAVSMSNWWVPAFTGAVAALLLGTVVRIVSAWIASQIRIGFYDCSIDGANDEPAKLRHAFGLRIDPRSDSLREPYRVEPTPVPPDGNPAWLYSDDRPRGRGHQHTQYGPYTNDFGYPRFARISFRIAGDGFLGTNEPVIVLDVLRAPFGGEREHTMLGQKIVRAGDLRNNYRNFSITCHVPGPGVYEYRATVIRASIDARHQHIFFKSGERVPCIPTVG